MVALIPTLLIYYLNTILLLFKNYVLSFRIYISLNNIIRNVMNAKNIERKKLLETMKKRLCCMTREKKKK